jgi:flagellar basal body-associated protein FliL
MQGKYALPRRRKKKGAAIALTVVLVLLALVCAGLLMLFHDPNEGRFDKVKADGSLAQKVLAASFAGGETTFSAEEANGFLAYAVQRYNKDRPAEKQLHALAVAGVSGQNADVYIRAPVRGKYLGVLLNVTPGFDAAKSRLVFRVNSARVGSLPAPAGPVVSEIGKRLPQAFSAEGDTIFCAAPGVTASAAGVTGSVKVTGLQLRQGRFVVSSKAELKAA